MASSSSLSLFDTTVPPLIKYLRNLDHLLTKAQDHLTANSLPESHLLTASIAPDMKPLPFQIQMACKSAANVAANLAGVEVPSQEGNETTFEQFHNLVATTISLLEKNVKREDFANSETKEIEFRGLKWTGLKYVTDFAIPNFYFHVVCAYMIFRANGVDVGKLDYLTGSGAAEAKKHLGPR